MSTKKVYASTLLAYAVNLNNTNAVIYIIQDSKLANP